MTCAVVNTQGLTLVICCDVNTARHLCREPQHHEEETMQQRWIIGMITAFLLTSSVVNAATLDVPAPNTTLSGIGVIHGWKCKANGELTIRFDGGAPLPLAYGNARADTTSDCGDTNNGFVSIMNWGNLGDGEHTAVVYDDGVEFDRSVFTVRRFRDAFVTGVSETVYVQDFPHQGENAVFAWNQATQHLELAEAGSHVRPPASGGSVEKWAEEQVDACYRKTDEALGPSRTRASYPRNLEHCLSTIQRVEYHRLWRDRYVRGLVQAITEAGGVEAWLMEEVQDCHPDGDIDPDLEDADCGDFVGWQW